MKTLLQDLTYALRQLRKSPGFTLTAVLSLACGIAATTAVFSVVWAVVVNPFPYAHADRMAHMALGSLDSSGGYNGFGINAAQWEQIRSVPAVEDSVLVRDDRLTVTGQDLPEDVRACYFSSNGFEFFGVPTALGRGILRSDAVGGADPQQVVVLGYKFWQRRYHRDPAIVGQTIHLQRKPYTVVGVAGPRFTWEDADVYLPMKLGAAVNGSQYATAELRLKPGVSQKLAEQQLQPLVKEFSRQTPTYFPFGYASKPTPLHVIGLNEQFLTSLGPTLALLFGAVLLLLAIGCGNVSILLLARGTARQHEFAIRAAVGASRLRIIRQLLTESILLSVSGALLGVMVSYKLLAVIVGLLPENAFPHEASIRINLPVLAFCVVVALVTGILFGLSPALRLSRPDVREAMQTGTARIAGNRNRTMHNVLIGGQIALTLLLLTTAGSAIQAFLKLARTPLGYDPHGVMSLGLPIRGADYSNIEARSAFVEAMRNKAAETPGVVAVAVSSNATPPDNGFAIPVQILGRPGNEDRTVRWNLVSPEYFAVLHVPLLRGRLWTGAEVGHAAMLAVVNESFARKYFAASDAIGHSIKTDALKPEPPMVVVREHSDDWLQVIGMVADKVDQGLGKPVVPEVYAPYTIGMGPYTQLLVRTQVPPLTLVHAIGMQIASVNADQQIGRDVNDLEYWIRTQPEYAQGQLVSWLFGGFAALALLLAAVGLYSVVSYTVAQRTNEFGIRMALGALRGNVLGLVMRSVAVSVGGGIALGVVLSLLLRRVLAHVVQGGGARDGYALVLALLVLSAVALVASGVPARRATRIEPMEALRYE